MSDPVKTLIDMAEQAAAVPKADWQATYGEREYPRVWGADDDLEPIVVVLGFLDPDAGRAVAEFIAAARTEHPALVDILLRVLELTGKDPADQPEGLQLPGHAEGYREAMSHIRTAITAGLRGVKHD